MRFQCLGKEHDCSTGCSWLIGPSSFSLCCGFLPPIKQSTGTKIMYSFFLVLSSVTAVLIHTGHVKQIYTTQYNEDYNKDFISRTCKYILRDVDPVWIESVASNLNVFYKKHQNGTIEYRGNMCTILTKFSSELVYLIFITMTLFHLFMAVLTLKVKHSHQKRAKIHNGFWLWKYLTILGIYCLFLFISGKSLLNPNKDEGFIYSWMYVGLAFASLFIIWKMIVLVNLANMWSTSWYAASLETPSKCKSYGWRTGVASLGLLMIRKSVLFFRSYGSSEDSSRKRQT